MKVDVTTEIVIGRPPADVIAYATNMDNVPQWYKNISSVEWKTPRPATLDVPQEQWLTWMMVSPATQFAAATWVSLITIQKRSACRRKCRPASDTYFLLRYSESIWRNDFRGGSGSSRWRPQAFNGL